MMYVCIILLYHGDSNIPNISFRHMAQQNNVFKMHKIVVKGIAVAWDIKYRWYTSTVNMCCWQNNTDRCKQCLRMTNSNIYNSWFQLAS